MDMIWTCEKCLYTFKTSGVPERCPDCGSGKIREASPMEKDWLYDLEMEKKHNPDLLDKIGSLDKVG